MAERKSLEVGLDAAGMRLDQFLAEAAGSRAAAQRLIADGRVLVDGVARPKRFELSPGAVVSVPTAVPLDAAPIDAGPPAPHAVLFEDSHLLIVEKPAGVVVHPARGNWSGTLAQALADRAAGGEYPWRAGIVHRLDRDTSGLLVVAKSDEVHQALKEMIKGREVHREYVALVQGRPESRTGTIDAPIGRHPKQRLMMTVDGVEPREARTHFEVERTLPAATLLRVLLETGRTHQIRVHLAAIGLPVCGDRQYGARDVFGLERQFLHAARLHFKHPVTGDEVDVSSELPADLASALDAAAAG